MAAVPGESTVFAIMYVLRSSNFSFHFSAFTKFLRSLFILCLSCVFLTEPSPLYSSLSLSRSVSICLSLSFYLSPLYFFMTFCFSLDLKLQCLTDYCINTVVCTICQTTAIYSYNSYSNIAQLLQFTSLRNQANRD
jgi:hypothetical protein